MFWMERITCIFSYCRICPAYITDLCIMLRHSLWQYSVSAAFQFLIQWKTIRLKAYRRPLQKPYWTDNWKIYFNRDIWTREWMPSMCMHFESASSMWMHRWRKFVYCITPCIMVHLYWRSICITFCVGHLYWYWWL